MWNMMCDVMPTISEDTISQRSSQFSREEENFQQLMVSMLEERDKIMDNLNETQAKLAEVEKERDSLQRQISANLPQVRTTCDTTIRLSAIQSCPLHPIWSFIDSPWQQTLTAIFNINRIVVNFIY